MAGWSFGSIYQRRQTGKTHPSIAGGVQQLAAGLILAPFALAFPRPPVHWSTRGVSALLYLVFFGSVVGYSAYAYALDRLPGRHRQHLSVRQCDGRGAFRLAVLPGAVRPA